MAELTEWKVPASAQPRVEDYGYDLERALTSIVGLHSIIPPDAFTAQTLGDERAGMAAGTTFGGGYPGGLAHALRGAEDRRGSAPGSDEVGRTGAVAQ